MWINVKDSPYSAAGNGTADDTTAIQNALNAASVAGGSLHNVVYFPPGTYRITSTLELYRSMGTRLIGVGNVKGTPAYLGGYDDQYTGAILYWDGEPGQPLLRLKGANYGSLENLTFVGATPQVYFLSTSTTSGDPGATFLRLNSTKTEIYASTTNFFSVLIPSWLDGLDAGTRGRLTIQSRQNAGLFVFDVTGTVTGSGSWRTVPVALVQSSGSFTANEEVIVSFVRTGGTPQPYAFSSSTSSNPANGTLRFDNATFASVTKIYADDLTASGFDIGTWLDKIDDQPDVRVTVNHATDNTKTRVFKVTGVTHPDGYRIINVTPIYSNGSIADTDPIVLSCSTPEPIRDRAAALVLQTSEIGWPAGHSIISNCTFLDAVNGLQLDDTTPTNNCADNTIFHCSFIACDAGIRVNSDQVVNNTIETCDFNDCSIGIDHAKGGDIRVFGASMNGFVGGVFLKIAGGGGNNASTFDLYGVRLEMKAGKPSLIETSGAFNEKNVLIDGFGWVGQGYPPGWDDDEEYDTGVQVEFNNTLYESLVENNEDNEPPTSPDEWRWLGDWVRPVRLGGRTNCTVRGAMIKGPFASVISGTETDEATLRLDHCRMPENSADVVVTDATGHWRQVDCTDAAGNPVFETGNWPISFKQTWNNITAGFTGIKLDVDDLASGSSSMLDLRVSQGESFANFNVDKSANLATTGEVGGKNLKAIGETVLTSLPALDATQTWNAGGVTFTALKLNVTDAASATGSLLMDLQVGGTSKVKADKTGKLSVQSLDVGGGATVISAAGDITLAGKATTSELVLPLFTQPAPTGQGENARDWTFTGAAGHSDNGASGFGGTGSSLLITLGNGGAGSAGDAGGGHGGNVRLTSGTGGSCNQSLAAAGNGGTLYLQPGAAGTPSGGAAAGSVGNVVVNEDQIAGAQFIVYGESQFVGGAMKMEELSSTPSSPASGSEAKLYVKSDKLIVQFNDGGTVRYKYLPLAAAGANWAETTTPP